MQGKMAFLFIAAFISVCLVFPVRAVYVSQQINDSAWLDSSNPATPHSSTTVYIGNDSHAVANYSAVFRYNFSGLASVADEIQSAVLLIELDDISHYDGANQPNFTVFGSRNQDWVSGSLTYNSALAWWDTPANSVSLAAWNNTFIPVLSKNLTFNVTAYVRAAYLAGLPTVTLWVNHTLNSTGNNFFGYVRSGNRFYLDINQSPAAMTVYSPTVTTYYNRFTVALNASNNTFIASRWFYSLNGNPNMSFSPNTSFVSNIGQNHLNVWVNSSTGAWYNRTVVYTIDINCSSQTVNDTICGGESLSYLQTCRQYSLSKYQWDGENQTYCTSGCFDGSCLDEHTVLYDVCDSGTTSCVDSKSYVSCENSSIGMVWGDNKTYCEFGCFAGKCQRPVSECVPGESRCKIISGKDYVDFCTDDNYDGVYTLSNSNKTLCTYSCSEHYIPSFGYNASCNYHSYTDVYGARNVTLALLGTPISMVDFGLGPRTIVWGFFSILIALALGFFTKSGIVSIITLMAMLPVGAVALWFPFYLAILLDVLLGVMFFLRKGGST